jgi:TM2 domain-containing membrane protein YozV/RNA polymerase subunit RPABC4/transcription elongation factor Spt4
MFCPNCGKEVQPGSTFCPACGKPISAQVAPAQTAQPSAVPTYAIKYCNTCGAQIAQNAEICPKCGSRVFTSQPIAQPQPWPAQPAPAQQHKNEGLAAVLSVIFIGLGQIYNGQIGKGILFLVVGIVFAALIFFLVGIILYPIFWIYNIYDAYSTAKKINAGQIRT